MSPGSFALQEGGLRCLVTLEPGPGDVVEGALELGDLRFRLRGWLRAEGELLGFVLDEGGRAVAHWRATLSGERLRLELRLPDVPRTHLTLSRSPGTLSA